MSEKISKTDGTAWDYSTAGSSCTAELAVFCVPWTQKVFIKDDVKAPFKLFKEPSLQQGEGYHCARRLFSSFLQLNTLQKAWTCSFSFTLYFWRRLLIWAALHCAFIGSLYFCSKSTSYSQLIRSTTASSDERFSIWSWGRAYNEPSTLRLLEKSRKMIPIFLETLGHYNCNYWSMNLKASPVLQRDIWRKKRLKIQKFEVKFFLTVTDLHIKL